MPRVVLAPLAVNDMEEILLWTEEHFGPIARERYEQLLIDAFNDVAVNPSLPGSHVASDIGENVMVYHLRNSRRVDRKRKKVKQPRHFLIYRLSVEGIVEIARILHDSMDLPRHLRPV